MKTKQKKIVFSVSKKYASVLEILENQDNKSEFICEAILAKIKNPKEDIKVQILEVIAELGLKNLITQNENAPLQIPQPIKNIVEPVANTYEEDDDDDDLMAAIAAMSDEQ